MTSSQLFTLNVCNNTRTGEIVTSYQWLMTIFYLKTILPLVFIVSLSIRSYFKTWMRVVLFVNIFSSLCFLVFLLLSVKPWKLITWQRLSLAAFMYTKFVKLNGLVVLHLYFNFEALKVNSNLWWIDFA